MSPSIASHTPNKTIEDIPSLFYGQLGVDLLTGRLYTKDINNRKLSVGGGIDYFREAKDYDTSLSSRNYYSLIGVNSQGFLIDEIPRISLFNLQGTDLEDTPSGIALKPYLALNSDNILINAAKPEFSLGELDDVSLGNKVDGFCLTRQNGRYNGKIVKRSIYLYSEYELRPNLSNFVDLDDLLLNPLTDYHVVRRRKQNEIPLGFTIINEPLRISGDIEPKLSNDLNAQGHAVHNLALATLVHYPEEDYELIDWNIDTYSTLLIDARDSNTSDLSIGITSSSLVNADKVGYVSILVKEYTGNLQFSNSRIKFENGLPPYIGGDYWLTGIIRNISGTYHLTVIQKASNIKRVST